MSVPVLKAAALTSLRAPSVLNTQPWRWRISDATLELHADYSRRLPVADPDDRFVLISCGAALHHARMALGAAGFTVDVERLPDPARPELLARLRLRGLRAPSPAVECMAAAIPRRRTDRRAFGSQPVTEATITRLRQAVEHEGAYLHLVPRADVPVLAVAGEMALGAEAEDPAFQAELIRWTSRPAAAGDGVPASVAVRPALRRVPVRDLAPRGDAGLVAGHAVDRGSAYVILYGLTDDPLSLLRAGEALSALLLLATAEGLATEPLSEAAELSWPRRLLSGLLAGTGLPFLAVRLGHPVQRGPLPPVPRREPADVIVIDEPREES
ncbi:hypothetical protein [Actinoplanes sp. N902-109]|uniref:Acg family FMN-binding oxidoreductase n=1 Tax=Actinoplanes sp. (strain N902-109) TaxID=649831 RepID=UPI000329589C|nr:hypothetical protein [Actinoplanes sp. N902-109]AGL16952.1 nitroreductase [Actinoplanes sp. N902-109]